MASVIDLTLPARTGDGFDSGISLDCCSGVEQGSLQPFGET